MCGKGVVSALSLTVGFACAENAVQGQKWWTLCLLVDRVAQGVRITLSAGVGQVCLFVGKRWESFVWAGRRVSVPSPGFEVCRVPLFLGRSGDICAFSLGLRFECVGDALPGQERGCLCLRHTCCPKARRQRP